MDKNFVQIGQDFWKPISKNHTICFKIPNGVQQALFRFLLDRGVYSMVDLESGLFVVERGSLVFTPTPSIAMAEEVG